MVVSILTMHEVRIIKCMRQYFLCLLRDILYLFGNWLLAVLSSRVETIIFQPNKIVSAESAELSLLNFCHCLPN